MPRPLTAVLVLSAALALPAVYAQQMPLNDTGQSLCYDDTDTNSPLSMKPCSAANTGDSADYPRQDGRFGRDARAAAGQLSKTGGGDAGFDFTKLCNSGEAAGTGSCPADPSLGTSATDWACTRDNVTRRVWEVKTADGGLRDKDWTYTWYDGSSGGPGNTSTCSNSLGGDNCNTQNYVTAVNDAQLCGFSDWRLPTRRELLSIVDYGKSGPATDTDYFPNTEGGYYWSADSSAPAPASAWLVYSDDGGAGADDKTYAFSVRLVRGGQ